MLVVKPMSMYRKITKMYLLIQYIQYIQYLQYIQSIQWRNVDEDEIRFYTYYYRG